MSKEKQRVKTLEENIMESADWSTSTITCIKCTQGDLERSLDPIVTALQKMRRDVGVNTARERLVAFYEPNQILQERVFTEKVSSAASALYYMAVTAGAGNTQSDKVHEYLRKHLEPIVLELERAPSPRVRHIAKRLRKVYEKRSSAPPMTREEKFKWGLIPRAKMTPKELVQVFDAEQEHARICGENNRRQQEYRETHGW